MRNAAVAGLTLLTAACHAPIKPEKGSFDWLAGCWRLERADGTYDEMWLPAGPDGSLGVARETRQGSTVSWEFMRIELRSGPTLVFVAHPARQQPAEFVLADHEPGRLAFENPKNSFPTRIEYRYVDLNALHARIEGPGKDGQTRAVDYPLRRVDCEG